MYKNQCNPFDFWKVISKKEQRELAIKHIERWLEKPDDTFCPFGKGWEGGCSLCITLLGVDYGCPCSVYGKEYTAKKAKEILQTLKSLP